MKISTKGRYALRVMIDLAQHGDEGFIALKDIAHRQELSTKYLEMIISLLHKDGMVESQRGKFGGYKLAKSPDQYSVGSILKLAEGSLAPVSCLGEEGGGCTRAQDCITLPMWMKLDHIINEYLDSVTIEDLINNKIDTYHI